MNQISFYCLSTLNTKLYWKFCQVNKCCLWLFYQWTSTDVWISNNIRKRRWWVQPGLCKSELQAYKTLYNRNVKMRIQKYSESTQECLREKVKCCQHCIRKLNTHMRNVFLCLKLEITLISLVAGDFFVKLEALLYVQEHPFQMSARCLKRLYM
jgi:hypothetical protein